MRSEGLRAQVRRAEDERVSLRLHGDLDLAGASILEALLREHETVDHIDLSDVETIDSSGLFALVLADTRARQQGFDLRLVPPPAPARRIFTWTGLDGRLGFVAG